MHATGALCVRQTHGHLLDVSTRKLNVGEIYQELAVWTLCCPSKEFHKSNPKQIEGLADAKWSCSFIDDVTGCTEERSDYSEIDVSITS